MKLPRDVSGNKALKAFRKAGWSLVRQQGSHMIMTKPDSKVTLSIPDHKTLGPGILKSLIHYAGLSVEEFLQLL